MAVLKLDALAAPPKGIAQRLEAVRGYAPEQNLSVLRALPAGTLGREYARFLDANGIEPLVISAAVKERFRENPFALRYTVTHDLHHVLTGFDTGLAGEAGDFAFSVGQGVCARHRQAALVGALRVRAALADPGEADLAQHPGRARARKAGEAPDREPLESRFEEPIGQVRADLGIPDPAVSGVLPSGHSVIGDALYKRKAPA